MGIPIGPDTSLLIAELLLSAVDKKIKRKHPRVRGFRFMDDYELTASSRHNAEIALGAIQEAMAEYEIALSPEKTSISELPCALDEAWVEPLRDFSIATSGARQSTEIIAYFNKTYSLAKAFPNKPVLAYAISRLRSVVVVLENWDIFQDLLLQSLLAEPGTFAPALAHFLKYRDLGYPIDDSTLTDVMNLLIVYQAPLGHASEVAWALWTVLTFRVTVKSLAAKALSNMSDSVVALLALDAYDQGLIPTGLRTDLWKSYLTVEDLYGEHWLLSYESSVKGWLIPPNDHIGADANFAWMRAIGVEFYDRTLTMSGTATAGPQQLVPSLEAIVGSIVDPYGPELVTDDGTGDVPDF